MTPEPVRDPHIVKAMDQLTYAFGILWGAGMYWWRGWAGVVAALVVCAVMFVWHFARAVERDLRAADHP